MAKASFRSTRAGRVEEHEALIPGPKLASGIASDDYRLRAGLATTRFQGADAGVALSFL
jgi:hypothetical protein